MTLRACVLYTIRLQSINFYSCVVCHLSCRSLMRSAYIEHVVTPEEVARNHHYHSPPPTARPLLLKSERLAPGHLSSTTHRTHRPQLHLQEAVADNVDPTPAPKRICIWASEKMDGQKTIWLQQIINLNKVSSKNLFVTHIMPKLISKCVV